MNTLATQDSLPVKSGQVIIPANIRGYFQQRLFSRTHQLLLQILRSVEESSAPFSKRMLSRKIEKKPEQITRWLSYPGNLTLETISDLALGMDCEITLEARSISRRHFELKSSIDILIMNITIDFVKPSQSEIQDGTVYFGPSSSNMSKFITRYEKLSHA